MLDALRDRMARHLADHDRCVIGAAGRDGGLALPVPYRARGLELECALPLWADLTYGLEEDPRVTVVIPPQAGEAEWLQVRGDAVPVVDPDWGALLASRPCSVAPGDLYRAVRVRPWRMDILGERGARHTLELE